MKSLYERISVQKIREVIETFYDKAFEDPLIGYFFRDTNREDLIAKQIQFSEALLGGPRNYSGVPLKNSHKQLGIRPAHFGRRQVLMKEALEECKVGEAESREWLAAEEKLRPLIVGEGQCVD